MGPRHCLPRGVPSFQDRPLRVAEGERLKGLRNSLELMYKPVRLVGPQLQNAESHQARRRARMNGFHGEEPCLVY